MALFRSYSLQPMALGPLANAGNIVLVFQVTSKIGHGLNREAKSPAVTGPRDWPMLAYGFKHNSPIVRSPKLLVRSP